MKTLAALCLLVVQALHANSTQSAPRRVEGQTLVSPSDSAVTLEFADAFHYAGSQRISLYGVAEAEQYFFVDADDHRRLRRWYWLQFEHFLPGNSRTYKYDLPERFKLGPLEFTADIRAVPGYFTGNSDPGSDSEATRRFLESKGYSLAGKVVRVRMFHLPDATHRKELMIIYGEALAGASLSGAAQREAQRVALEHARQNLTVRAQQPASAQSVAFTDISVLPMDSDRVLQHYTVVVQNGKIAQVAPADTIQLSADAKVIDGRGKFLIPGLADMHIHVDRKEMLPLFLDAGVTTVLNMGLASPEFVTQTRHEVRHGTTVGPQLFIAFLIDGPGDPGPQYVATCEADARQAVDRAKLIGYDFIKVYSRLQPDIYAAILGEAHKKHIAVVGHVAKAVGLEKSLAAGQVMVAHGEEYYKTYFGDKPDESLIPSAVELTRKAGAYVTPNLSFFASLTPRTANPEVANQQLASPESRLIPPDMRGNWLLRTTKGSDRFVAELQIIQRLTVAMSKAGVPLLTGTDTPALGMVPGTSVPEELHQLVAAGLTPYQALSAATRIPGQFIQQFAPGTEEFGTIEPGKRADLVVLTANPFADIKNVRHPLGVMAGGRWLEARELEEIIERPLPAYDRVKGLEAQFQGIVSKSGAVEAIRQYAARSDKSEKLPESFLNSLGYQLISAQKLDDAIAVFTLDTELYPQSWNVWDSLGEAYLDAGQRDLAIVNYRHSLALNSRNVGAERILQSVEAH